MLADAKVVDSALGAGFMPDPLYTVSEWSDAHRVLPQKGAAEPGPWRTNRFPFLKEIMDCLSPSSPVQEIAFMKGAQVGGTETGNNWVGFIIDHAPGPMMAVQPTSGLAERYSKQRIAPLLEETPRLVGKVKDKRKRDSGNTLLMKEFQGGVLIMAGANSAVQLRSMPARYLFLDEIDGYPQEIDDEGDPISLAVARTRTYRTRRKIFKVSTPKLQGSSRIEDAYENSDKRKYHVPCPHCENMDWIRWRNIRWQKGKPETAVLVCESCGCEIEERHKTWMLARGEWVAENPGHRSGRVAGFHLSALYSPYGFYSWGESAEDWESAKRSPKKLKTFVNTVLGETWKDKGEAPDWKRLFQRRENYPFNRVPSRSFVLTAGADVQADRIEVEIVSWGRNFESWSIDYRVFPGDTGGDEVWENLDRLLTEEWEHEKGGRMRLDMLAIDCSYNTSKVKTWVRKKSPSQVMAVQGESTTKALVGQPKKQDINRDKRGNKKRIYRGVLVWPVGVDIAKMELYSWLRQDIDPENPEEIPEGYCHFPQHDPEYWKQLTAEQLVSHRTRTGHIKYEWEQTRERNEALDCRNYARAASYVVGIDRFTEEAWLKREEQITGGTGRAASKRPKKRGPKVIKPDDPYLNG